jgi:hypothetical protein
LIVTFTCVEFAAMDVPLGCVGETKFKAGIAWTPETKKARHKHTLRTHRTDMDFIFK